MELASIESPVSDIALSESTADLARSVPVYIGPNRLFADPQFCALSESDQNFVIVAFNELLTSTAAYRGMTSSEKGWLPFVPVPHRRLGRWGSETEIDAFLWLMESANVIEQARAKRLPPEFRLVTAALAEGFTIREIPQIGNTSTAVSELEHFVRNASAAESVLFDLATGVKLETPAFGPEFEVSNGFEQLQQFDAFYSLRTGRFWSHRDWDSGLIITPLFNLPLEAVKRLRYANQPLMAVRVENFDLLCVGLIARDHRGERDDIDDFVSLAADGTFFREMSFLTGFDQNMCRQIMCQYVWGNPDEITSPESLRVRELIGDVWPNVAASVAYFQHSASDDLCIGIDRIRRSISDSASTSMLAEMPANGFAGVLADGMLVLSADVDDTRTALENAFRSGYGISPLTVVDNFGE